ncbi:MAG: type IV pilus assembly protein PilM [Flavobacteriaceae bacterium]|jgi:type IV pilus assembly protein PilM
MKDISYSTAFPTPTFLAMPTLGIDISDESIKYLELVHSKTGLEVGKYGKIIIKEGTLLSGSIQNEKGFIGALLKLREQTGSRFVRLSLPEEQIYLFEVTISSKESEDMRGSIEMKLPEHVPLETADIIFDYDLVHQEGDMLHVQVAATSRRFVENYLSPIKASHLEPLSFEIEAQAVARAVVPRGDNETYLIVDFGRTRTGISIVSHGLVLFTSTLSVGGNSIMNDMVKKTGKTLEEVEKIKNTVGLSKKTDPALLTILEKHINTLSDEINKHYVYWSSQQGHTSELADEFIIKGILLCGGEANIPGLAKFLEEKLDSTIIIPNVWQNVNTLEDYVPPISREISLSYSTAIGLALGDIEHD